MENAMLGSIIFAVSEALGWAGGRKCRLSQAKKKC
jgi:hypothetical protein